MLLTQSQKRGGGGGKTEDVLDEIAADILNKVNYQLYCINLVLIS